MSQHPDSSVTRFLISDPLTRHDDVTEYPLGLAYDNPAAPNEKVARSRECREYLLEAGADPTLETDYASSALYDAISMGDTMDAKESVS